MKAREILDTLLETNDPYSKKSFSLEYRPYKRGDDWFWFWVLHPEDKQRAIAHGQSDSRAAASIAARLKARELKGVITQVNVQESLWGRSKSTVRSKLGQAAWGGKIDWKRADDELADEYSVSPARVRRFRRTMIPWKPKRMRRAADNKVWGK